MTYVRQGHFNNYPESNHAPRVITAIVSFYRVNSDTAFKRNRSRIPSNDLNRVHALKKHIIEIVGLKERTIKYGLTGGPSSIYE